MFAESELLPLSGLQHLTFCERRFALVHIEQQWSDNVYTTEGSLLHEKAHSGEIESRPGVLIRRSLALHSFRLGLTGFADVVEFVRRDDSGKAIRLEGRRGLWAPHPIEYKRRRDHAGSAAYRVQLCGQALCLEEMWGIEIDVGAVYDASTKRRQHVDFNRELRHEVERAAFRMHEMCRKSLTPPPILTAACKACSLYEICQPKWISNASTVAAYLSAGVGRRRLRRVAKACLDFGQRVQNSVFDAASPVAPRAGAWIETTM